MYTLTLTKNDVETIAWVGYRYCWSDVLAGLTVGENGLEEYEAWEIVDAFRLDTEGGHSPFPCLADGNLKDKLYTFWNEVV